MKEEIEMRFGVEYEFECRSCCNSKDDKTCKLTAESEMMPEFCPFEENKRCNWKMVNEEGIEDEN